MVSWNCVNILSVKLLEALKSKPKILSIFFKKKKTIKEQSKNV